MIYAFAQLKIWREAWPGTFHAMFFWGMGLLTIGTIIVLLQADFGIPIMRGWLYLIFQSLILDIAGIVALIGICLALFNRFILKPKRLQKSPGDGFVLVLLAFILFTGFLIEGLRIAATSDPWSAWSPVGQAFSAALSALITAGNLPAWHRIIWWVHTGATMVFIAYIPYSKLFHLITGPLNVAFRDLNNRGSAPKPMSMEDIESLGASKLEDFTWKDLLDLDACTECGRCEASCPANRTGKPLSPRTLILNLRQQMRNLKPGVPDETPLIDDAISPEALWSCTTCMACVEQCPVLVEHIPKIIEMRRYQTMELSEFPETMQDAIRSLEARAHPFRGTQNSRTDWCQDLNLNTMADVKSADVLLWIGCAGTFDERNMKTSRALARLLQKANVDFAILGDEERCTGDPARRMGQEYLFQMMAQQNIETLNQYSFKTIVSACPHCVNSLKNDYRQLGTKYTVLHHSEFLAKLIAEGKLKPTRQLKSINAGERENAPCQLTFHDPCYLGRYQGQYDAPRQIIGALPSCKLTELEENRHQSFCCGGGGGLSWAEENIGTRINQSRADQILATGAGTVATACPYCMTMLNDGVNARREEREINMKDIAELLDEATD
ncbi:MAG: heterodisulfide reductase-related iron-sulfur binding cluster [Dehalobacterium sp.]